MRKSLLLILLALSCVAWTGCGLWPNKGNGDEPEKKNEEKADTEIVIPIQAELPRRADISSHFETNSRVEAEDQVQVTAEGVGECLKVYVEEGDRVSAGQVLAELDRAEVLAQIGQTEVNIRQTKTEYDRAAQGFKDGIMAEVERDNAKFAYEQALATLETQRVQLGKLTVRAPLGGIVTQRAVQEGQLVSVGTPVFSIVDPSSYLLRINAPERRLQNLHKGQQAKVTLDALGNEEFVATVRRVNPNVDPVSGLVKVTLDFDKETLSRLHEGAFARVRLIIDTHENALLVPKDAVLEENARRYVFVVEEKK
ncbi:MAG: efflux RND transporter periplasmic adaptor subunit, partial [Nitrospiraceae bacterium]|nr:efflux RND transporter periplasmic adaptor subunit [Nitrospiraceae bacterium]